jgi:hypothetical protein
MWKTAALIGYNLFALTGMFFYGVKLRGKRLTAGQMTKKPEQLGTLNLFIQGSKHGVYL